MSESAKKKRSIAITMGGVKPAEFKRQHLVCDVPEGTVPSDLREPSFWAFVAYKLQPFDRLEVRANDGTWISDCIVVMCDRTWAKVKILNHYDLSTPEEVEDSANNVSNSGIIKHESKWLGPSKKWGAVRLSDSQVVKDGMESKKSVEDWIREHEKAF